MIRLRHLFKDVENRGAGIQNCHNILNDGPPGLALQNCLDGRFEYLCSWVLPAQPAMIEQTPGLAWGTSNVAIKGALNQNVVLSKKDVSIKDLWFEIALNLFSSTGACLA